MATVTEWTPFEVALDITATAGTVTRKSATQYTVVINASWETYYNGAYTNYGMTASSGGGSVNLNSSGNKADSGSGSFTGTYSISGNGSATKTVTVTFTNYNSDNGNSATKNVSFNVTVPAWTSYTVSYNANGGTGAPSSQTKWKDQTLTLSSTIPKRTGYTFKFWQVEDTGTKYNPSQTYTKNESVTLVAVWSENILTVNYYSNYATSAFADALNTVGSDKNVKVWTYDFYYDNDYSTYGLANYSNSSGSVYMTRTGYTGTGEWGTSTSGGYLVGENDGFVSGQAVAEAFGKSIKTGNASVNVYAQWRPNVLTIMYHASGGVINSDKYYTNGSFICDSSISDVLQVEWEYNNGHADGLYNASTFGLSRLGYDFIGWSSTGVTTFTYTCTLEETVKEESDGDNNRPWCYRAVLNNATYYLSFDDTYEAGTVITITSTDGVFSSNQCSVSTSMQTTDYLQPYILNFDTEVNTDVVIFDQNDASIVPTDITNDIKYGDCTAVLYAEWKLSGVVYIDNGNELEKYLVYIDNGNSWDLYLPYIDNGNSWDVIS